MSLDRSDLGLSARENALNARDSFLRPDQFKDRIVISEPYERSRRGPRRYGTVALDRETETIQVCLQDRGLFFVWNHPESHQLVPSPLRQRDFSAGVGVPDPLGLPPSRYQETLPVLLEHVHRRSADVSALATPDLEEEVVT